MASPLLLSSLLPDILGRIEENVENGPVFWSLTGEVYPAMVDGMFEASLISGVVQLVGVQVSLPANRTYFPLNPAATGLGSLPTGIIKGIVAALRMRAPYSLRKTTLESLDSFNPGWEQATPKTQIISWFPLGTSGFGIYPQLSAAQNVVMDFLYSPLNEYRPYNGSEPIPFQHEFTDILSKYGAAQLRSKEGGMEAETAETVYTDYLAETKDLSLFQQRLDSLVYTAAFGGKATVNTKTAI